mmetsp:Transcript_28565/g.32054  ORF Transcript_28565/g.32054 Transcript_28565/m.32054 type:complete len:797 (+) Transcript_28565:23-2413(+)
MTTILTAAMMNRLQMAIRNRPWTVAGATIVIGGLGYRKYKEEERLIKDSKKKKVLVLPFYKMRIVEEKKSSPNALLENLAGIFDGSGNNKVIEMQADELISLIREAAEDPSIEGMYGIFGNGGTISTGGWAHLEEIRNALQVFATKSLEQNQNLDTDTDTDADTITKQQNKTSKKTMYAYSNTFGGQQSMQEYYLASVFKKIHLQSQGDLNLYGLHTTNAFFRDFLKRYGITVNVWKHGAYKNMANVFTHSKYSKEHYENTAGVLLPIHQHICKAIYTSRHEQLEKYGYDFTKFWSMIENAGSLPATVAHQIGFIDYLPRKNPLHKLIKNNNHRITKEEITNIVISNSDSKGDVNIHNHNTNKSVTTQEKDKNVENNGTDGNSFLADEWKLETDSDNFKADSTISIDDYALQKDRLRRKAAKKWKLFQSVQSASQSNIVAKQLLSLLGYSSPNFNIAEENFSEEKARGLIERIAIIKINGIIGEATARKVEKALKKVKEQKDIKCVVLRVDSGGGSINACETIYQEIQDIPQKVVVSFGNVSASGGYYISSNAEQIFASPTTITGSIGVVLLRMDFSELARRYGITFDSISTSALSGSNDPVSPVNNKMNENFINQADRSYHRFKSLVSEGRNIDMKTVEAISRGRVYTGDRAHQIGLVDKLGGLDSAVAFAQRNYTSSGEAQVMHWPPKRSLWELIFSNRDEREDDTGYVDLDLPDVLHTAFVSLLKGIMVTISDRFNISAFYDKVDSTPSFLSVTSGVMLTLDENTAIQCVLEDMDIPQAKLVNGITDFLTPTE